MASDPNQQGDVRKDVSSVSLYTLSCIQSSLHAYNNVCKVYRCIAAQAAGQRASAEKSISALHARCSALSSPDACRWSGYPRRRFR